MKYIILFIAFFAISGTVIYQGVRHDATMTGSGITGDELKADTATYLATRFDLTSKVSMATSIPASASASGVEGQIAWDGSYIYVCTATDTWKRSPIASW